MKSHVGQPGGFADRTPCAAPRRHRPGGIQALVWTVPREEKVFRRMEAEPFSPLVQLAKGFKACVVKRGISPPRRRLRSSHREAPLFPGDVLPLQRLDLA